MATQTDLQLLLTKGPLGSLPSTRLNGRLAIGLDDTNEGDTTGRAKLFIDDDGVRYEFNPLWDEIIDKPELVLISDYEEDKEAYEDDKTEIQNSIATKVDIQNGTAINLGIAASATTGAKVQLRYNATTESLDFTFT